MIFLDSNPGKLDRKAGALQPMDTWFEAQPVVDGERRRTRRRRFRRRQTSDAQKLQKKQNFCRHFFRKKKQNVFRWRKKCDWPQIGFEPSHRSIFFQKSQKTEKIAHPNLFSILFEEVLNLNDHTELN